MINCGADGFDTASHTETAAQLLGFWCLGSTEAKLMKSTDLQRFLNTYSCNCLLHNSGLTTCTLGSVTQKVMCSNYRFRSKNLVQPCANYYKKRHIFYLKIKQYIFMVRLAHFQPAQHKLNVYQEVQCTSAQSHMCLYQSLPSSQEYTPQVSHY